MSAAAIRAGAPAANVVLSYIARGLGEHGGGVLGGDGGAADQVALYWPQIVLVPLVIASAAVLQLRQSRKPASPAASI